MRWPWSRKGSGDQLVVSWSGQTLAYVLAQARQDGTFKLLKLGVERQGSASYEDFVHRLQALGLKGFEARFMLRPEQYQLLQIDAPAVPPEELRSAARYQIREMISAHLDDVTLDVMRVGDGQQKGKGHLFVVAATNAVVRSALELGDAMHWNVSVIDIQETAQRNLQSALAAREGRAEGANAALVLVEGQEAVLTISANEELFYSRSFELPEGFLKAAWGRGNAPPETADSAFAPVDDYVPDYSVGGVAYGNDYSDTRTGAPSAVPADALEDDRSQRFLVEVQRSLDVWDRSWSSMPLGGLRVYAGERSGELAKWLSTQLAQPVVALDVKAFFPGLEGASSDHQALCLPLLGVLMRSESRRL
jgi:MSHA biogenesis protein MshI